jgi:hypothetical protein
MIRRKRWSFTKYSKIAFKSTIGGMETVDSFSTCGTIFVSNLGRVQDTITVCVATSQRRTRKPMIVRMVINDYKKNKKIRKLKIKSKDPLVFSYVKRTIFAAQPIIKN